MKRAPTREVEKHLVHRYLNTETPAPLQGPKADLPSPSLPAKAWSIRA